MDSDRIEDIPPPTGPAAAAVAVDIDPPLTGPGAAGDIPLQTRNANGRTTAPAAAAAANARFRFMHITYMVFLTTSYTSFQVTGQEKSVYHPSTSDSCINGSICGSLDSHGHNAMCHGDRSGGLKMPSSYAGISCDGALPFCGFPAGCIAV